MQGRKAEQPVPIDHNLGVLNMETEPEYTQDNPMPFDLFLKRAQLEMAAVKVFDNPNWVGREGSTASHYQIRLRRVGFGFPVDFVFFYSMGSAHVKGPKLRDVVDCLISDANIVHSTSDFLGFCSELGYSPDSRTAERSYTELRGAADKFRACIGNELYQLAAIDGVVERL